MITKYEKPIPLKTEDNQPYWDAADRHELKLQKCNNCDSFAHPPGPACAKCGSQDLSWESLGNNITGTVNSYIISNRPFMPGFQNDLPTIIAHVSLDIDPEVKIICNVLDGDPNDIEIGMSVKMFWEDITEDRALPQWKPV